MDREARGSEGHDRAMYIEMAEIAAWDGSGSEREEVEGAMGTVGEEDVYFFGEVGVWKSEQTSDLRVQDVPETELPRWDKRVLEGLGTLEVELELEATKGKSQAKIATSDIWVEALANLDKQEREEELEREREARWRDTSRSRYENGR